ncbi:type IV pili twitching motility protein PilT [Candidatus Peregrinibacteria bacterium HGW-Peregrinibacteria-1]|jgi:twitching motility protein PilT|nr:MAG: type IV pili twitching motility protein PilT [Candidatus Peregrinibacteria bacterium HGW-Peregrinibacteria-1]
MYKLAKIFRTAVKYRASDIYISTGVKPTLRINGDLVSIGEHPELTKKMAEEYLLEMLTPNQKQFFEQNLDLDFSVEIDTIARFRVNMFVQRKGIGAVFRLIPEKIQSIDELALPNQLRKAIQFKNGLVVITGPTGSGKTTTLAAMVNEINKLQRKHIITIEDPIEYTHQNNQSIVQQREVGTHTNSFSKALRSALREAPDVILLGEMRDYETIRQAITAAETGHLVIATLHTRGCANSINRIIDSFPTNQQNQIRSQLSESLRAVFWQNLIKTRDGKGRIPATEIMFVNNGIANLIRKNSTHQINSVIETSSKEGMQTMKKSLEDLYNAGLITQEDTLANMPVEFRTS